MKKNFIATALFLASTAQAVDHYVDAENNVHGVAFGGSFSLGVTAEEFRSYCFGAHAKSSHPVPLPPLEARDSKGQELQECLSNWINSGLTYVEQKTPETTPVRPLKRKTQDYVDLKVNVDFGEEEISEIPLSTEKNPYPKENRFLRKSPRLSHKS